MDARILWGLVWVLSWTATQAQSLSPDSLYDRGDFAAAAAAYAAAAARAPADSVPLYRLWEARSYAQQYEMVRARQLVSGLLATAPPDAPWQGRAYFEMAYTYVLEGASDKADSLAALSVATQVARPRPDTLYLAKAQEVRGMVAMQRGALDTAAQRLRTSHTLLKALLPPNSKAIGYIANSLFMVYDQRGDIFAADTAIAEAWRILSAQLPAEHPHLGILASNYGVSLMNVGDPARARSMLLRTVAANRQAGRHRSLVADYVNLGILYENLEEPVTARTYIEQAWQLADSLYSYPGVERANILDALGATYYAQENLPDADSLFRRALREKETYFEGGHPAIAQSYFNLGLLAQSREDWSEAKRYFGRSAAMRAQFLGNDHPKYADVLQEIGSVAWAEGDTATAYRQWRAAIAVYRQQYGLGHRHTIEALLTVLSATHEPKRSDSLLCVAWAGVAGLTEPLSSVSLLDTLRVRRYDPQVLELANLHLGRVLTAPEVLPEAVTTSYAVAERVYAWLPDFLALYPMSASAETVGISLQRFYRQTLVLAHRARAKGGAGASAWEQLLLRGVQASRGSTVRAALRARQAVRFAGVPDAVVARDDQLRTQLRFAFSRQDEEGGALPAPLLAAWQAHQDSLRQHHARYFRARYLAPPPDHDALRASLRREQATVVAYVDLDSALLAVRVSADTLRTFYLTPPPGWADSVLTYRRLLATAQPTPRAAALGYFCYRHLWLPVAAGLPTNVRVLPDGSLYYLNFETLPTAPKAGPYLIDEHCIYYAHGFGGSEGEALRPNRVLGVAPGFSAELKEYYRSVLPADAAPDTLFLGWLRTPWSRALVEALAVRGGQALTDTAATEAAYRRHATHASVLHFGTHARLSPESPLESYLALTPDPTTAEDGYLRTYELYEQPLNAQLAVLTACETGLGRYQKGEGVLSLAHAFRYAGCPAVLHSLWQIDDEQSSALLTHFYEALRAGTSPAQALRAAKLKYRQAAPAAYQSPFYWGGLVLTGDNPRVSRPWRRRLGWGLGIGGLLVVTLGGALLWWRSRGAW